MWLILNLFHERVFVLLCNIFLQNNYCKRFFLKILFRIDFNFESNNLNLKRKYFYLNWDFSIGKTLTSYVNFSNQLNVILKID